MTASAQASDGGAMRIPARRAMLTSVANRARTIDERRAALPADPGQPNPDEAIATRSARWRATAARGVEIDFVRRLSHAGFAGAGDAARILTESGPDPVTEVPPWLEILDAAARRPAAPGGRPAAGHELDALLRPLLDEAVDRLRASHGELFTEGVSEAALAGLRDGVRRDLSRVVGPCVDTELSAFRSRCAGAADHWPLFEQELSGSGLFVLWDAYPVLARLVGVRLLDWVDRSAELLRRFGVDRPDLARTFGMAEPLVLESVELAGSDPHNHHAEVAVCTISGQRLVYKPKDLSAEALWSELIRWADGVGLDLGAPGEVLLGDGYGWARYVEQLPTDADGARRFYTRIGRLAAMLFVLGGNDAHAENIVACGDTPVVVDAETVLQPTIPAEDGEPGPEWIIDALLLPRWLRIGGTAVDLSATGAPGTAWQRTVLRWNVRSAMELVPVRTSITEFSSTLRSPTGLVYRPEDHAAEIVSGFRQGWVTIRSHATDFTGAGGWLDRLCGVRVRVLVRMTRTYQRLLDTASDPVLLRSGIDRSIHLDHLARVAFDRAERGWLGLADAERRMMENNDVPFFSVRADQDVLCDTDGTPLITFDESSLNRARRRLSRLGDDDLHRQAAVIDAALAVAPTGCRSNCFARQRDPRGARDSEPIDPRTAAIQVAARIHTQVETFGGPAAPLSLVAATPSQWSIDVAGPGLYDGRIGLAVALAAGAAALEDDALAELARRTAQPIVTDALTRPRRLILRYGLGGQDGTGGILLGFALMQRLTRHPDPDLESAFVSLMSATTEDDVTGSEPLDLLAGLPGFVAGFTAGARVGWRVADEVSGAARDRLSSAVTEHLAAVDSGAAPPMNGFSHGDAGLAAVLAGLAGFSGAGSGRLRALSAALVASESNRFEPELRGWRDLRPGADNSGQGPGWCNGFAGIALSRALIRQQYHAAGLPAPDDLMDAEPARMQFTEVAADRLGRDTLCCGAAGNLAVVQTLSNMAADEQRELWRPVSDTLTADLATAAVRGRLRIGAPPTTIAPLGLFQGLGGVLYALALASAPHLPSVLSWGTDLGTADG